MQHITIAFCSSFGRSCLELLSPKSPFVGIRPSAAAFTLRSIHARWQRSSRSRPFGNLGAHFAWSILEISLVIIWFRFGLPQSVHIILVIKNYKINQNTITLIKIKCQAINQNCRWRRKFNKPRITRLPRTWSRSSRRQSSGSQCSKLVKMIQDSSLN